MLLVILMLAAQGVMAQGEEQIGGWDTSLPQAQARIVELIQMKAIQDFYWEDEGLACGGETGGFELSDYFTDEDLRGVITYKIKLKFFVTRARDYCRTVDVLQCEVPVSLKAADDMKMAKWNCFDAI